MPYKQIAIKNHSEEIHLINRRVIAALIVIGILITLLIARLYYLQHSKHDLYTTLSKRNSLDLVPVEPTRGLIFDRNGTLLTDNTPVFSLDIIPHKVQSLSKTISDISKLIPLSDTEISQFQKQLKEHRRFEEIPIKLRLTEAELARFAENQYRFPGVIIKARLMRYYPYGNSLSHILGYVGRINNDELNEIDPVNYSASNYIGKIGIEKFYEEELHGKVGYQQVENDASGESIRILHQIKSTPGENLYLTIDVNLQLAIEKAMAGHRGAIVAIQPSTGQILALVSEPTFDPNLFVAGISNDDFQKLQKSIDKPLYNRAIRGLYPLASTIKPYIALQGLNTGVTNTSYTIFDPGWYKLKNSEHVFRDWRHKGHGTVNLHKAIQSSCDVYFYDLGNRLGIHKIDDILTQFGFGEPTDVDINDELAGVVASPDWKNRTKGVAWYPGDTLNASIGQGYMQATPIQLASALATLANRGKRIAPYFLLSEQPVGKPPVPTTPTLLKPIVLNDDQYWEIVINAMHDVMATPQGTGYAYFGQHYPYTVAGKTGTAQVYSFKQNSDEERNMDENKIPERLRDHHLLVIFAPIDNPQIALAIIVENSAIAANVAMARQILDYYLVPKKELNQHGPA